MPGTYRPEAIPIHDAAPEPPESTLNPCGCDPAIGQECAICCPHPSRARNHLPDAGDGGAPPIRCGWVVGICAGAGCRMIALRTIPIYDIDIHLFNDRSQALGFYLENCPGGAEERTINTARGCCVTDGPVRMLCVFDGGLPIAAHESVHMAWAVLQECGIKVNPANDEPLAYLAGWLTKQTADFLAEAA